MHAIKSQAKRQAWKYDSYNPWSKRHMQNRENSRNDPEKGLSRPNTNTVSTPQDQSPVDNISPVSRDGLAISNNGHPVNGQAMASNSTDSSTSKTGTRKEFSQNNVHPSMKDKAKNLFHRGGSRKADRDMDGANAEQNDGSKKKKFADQKFTFMSQFRATVFGSWINVLLICVPVGIGLHYSNVNEIAVFVINFLAIIPLAGMLSYSTEEISMRVGETLGGLMNASFGNAVELIVSIIALAKNEILIVQTSLIGSMLSNLLLVMGMCFFFGGLKRETQKFNITVAQTASSLLALAVGSLIIPTVFHDWGSASTPEYRETKIPALSHGTAVILLLVYGCYLFFQLRTHASMYNQPSEKTPYRSEVEEGSVHRGVAQIGAGTGAQAAGGVFMNNETYNPNATMEDAGEQPALSVVGAIVTLCISTALVGICAEFMVDGIGSITKSGGISPEFVGLILIPIVGNAAEHATAVTVACKDKMDLAIGVAVGSSLQIALFVLPFVVVLGWIMGKTDMTLEFDGFLIALLFVTIILVNYLIADGQSHWLEGVLLMATYIIIAVAAYFYPEDASVIG